MTPPRNTYLNRKKSIRERLKAGRITPDEARELKDEARAKYHAAMNGDTRLMLHDTGQGYIDNHPEPLPCTAPCPGGKGYKCSCPCGGTYHGAAYGREPWKVQHETMNFKDRVKLGLLTMDDLEMRRQWIADGRPI